MREGRANEWHISMPQRVMVSWLDMDRRLFSSSAVEADVDRGGAPRAPSAGRGRRTLHGVLRFAGLAIAVLIVTGLILVMAGFPLFS